MMNAQNDKLGRTNNHSDVEPNPTWWPVVGVLVLAALARVIPHVSNVTPFFAVAIAAGAWLGRSNVKLTAVIAVTSMLLSDLILGFHWTMPFVYAGLGLGVFSGAVMNGKIAKTENLVFRSLLALSAAGSASVGFFLISNFGVWLVGGIYPMTADGLVQCFVLAIPFFAKSLMADIFFGSIFLLTVVQLKNRQAVAIENGASNA